MKEIQLNQNEVALIDDEDFERIAQFKWCAKDNGNGILYAQSRTRIAGKERTILMHRLILNAPKGVKVDHRNHNGLDNRRENLRFATASQNAQNARKRERETTSKYKGVYWDKYHQKWCAKIALNRKRKLIGYFNSEIVAAASYDSEAIKAFGEYARINFDNGVLETIRKINSERMAV